MNRRVLLLLALQLSNPPLCCNILGSIRSLGRPEAQIKQLLRGVGKGGVKTHLLSVAGESLAVAEERPGLSDHRQQGRQLLQSGGESQEMATGHREMQNKEKDFSVS